MNWDAYAPHDLGVSEPLQTVPRAEARRAYTTLMQERPVRLDLLRRLLAANGVELATTDAGIQQLNDWFVANIQPDPARPGRPAPEWYAVILDSALFLGEVIIARCPGVQWTFFTRGKKNVCYQRPVLLGFADYPTIPLDIWRQVSEYANRLVAEQGSIRHHGVVVVRGVPIDVDAATARARERPGWTTLDAFLQMVRRAESQMAGERSSPEATTTDAG
jgi:hypothetical protein